MAQLGVARAVVVFAGRDRKGRRGHGQPDGKSEMVSADGRLRASVLLRFIGLENYLGSTYTTKPISLTAEIRRILIPRDILTVMDSVAAQTTVHK